MREMNDFFTWMMDDDTATAPLKTMQETSKRSGGSNLFCRYKKMDFGGSVTVRFLPASQDVAENEARPKFWLPKKVIRLRFDNPDQTGSEVVLTIPVMQMFKGGKTEDDLILKQVKVLYDEADKLAKAGEEERAKEIRAKASYHWTRGECIAQGWVIRANGFNEADPPENPIRLFELNKQVMNIIQSSVNSEDPDTRLEYWPVHGKKGSHFVIKKTKSGEWPSYTSSCFARQTTPWTTEQTESIATHHLWRLEDFLPARPSDDEYQLLAQIVEQSIAGDRVWNPDWEDELETVKVFKTNSTDDDPAAAMARVHETVGLVGTDTVSTSDIVSSLSRTARREPEPTQLPAGDPEPALGDDTRAMVDKIRRGAKAMSNND